MNIKKTLKDIVIASMIGLATLVPTKKAEAGINVNVALKNKYLAQVGFILEKEPMVIQPSITLSEAGFYGMLWSNFNTENGLSEIDYIVGYGRNVLGLDFDISYNLFDLKNIGEGKINDNIHELWLNISKPGVISPKLRLVQNFSGGNLKNSRGNYAYLSLSHNRNIEKVPISLEGNIQYNNKYFIGNRGFSVAQASFSLPFEVDGISITPKIRFQKAIDKDNFENSTDLGLSLNYSF